MNTENSLKFIAAPLKVFITIIILLFVLFIAQIITIGIIHEIDRTFSPETEKKEVTKSWEEHTEAEKQLKITKNSSKKFSPDGTFLQVYNTSKHLANYKRPKKNEDEIIQIYDINNTMLWEGKRKDNPYESLTWASRPDKCLKDVQTHHYRIVTPALSRHMEIPVR